MFVGKKGEGAWNVPTSVEAHNFCFDIAIRSLEMQVIHTKVMAM